MGLIVSVLIGAIVAIIFYAVATALVAFAHSTLIIGLIALLIFVVIAFGGAGAGLQTRYRGWRGGP